MLGLCFQPVVIPATAALRSDAAYSALADAAAHYLRELDAAVARGEINARVALNTRIRGTGPGVAFGDLVRRLGEVPGLKWQTPFEGSSNVSGAALPGDQVLGRSRDDGFLFLRFAPATGDLPLHTHPDSDRFIFVVGGRGFFHTTGEAMDAIQTESLVHVPARDRDVLMFRRGTVHTFSTAAEPLELLSYHRPFVALDDPAQYEVSAPPLTPNVFLRGLRATVSFDAAWNALHERRAAGSTAD
jgi:mannose-6-phosphate isomerase-like protein (cupin superfamily)